MLAPRPLQRRRGAARASTIQFKKINSYSIFLILTVAALAAPLVCAKGQEKIISCHHDTCDAKDLATQSPATWSPATKRPTTQRPATWSPATRRPTTRRPTTWSFATRRPATVRRRESERQKTKRQESERWKSKRQKTERQESERRESGRQGTKKRESERRGLWCIDFIEKPRERHVFVLSFLFLINFVWFFWCSLGWPGFWDFGKVVL